MIVTRAGLALMGLVDVLMLARHNAADLAALGLLEGTFGRLLDICVAAVLSALPVAGAAFAAGGAGAVKAVWRRSLLTALAAGALLALVAVFALPILTALGHRGELGTHAAALVPVAAVGAAAGLLAMASALALEAMGRARQVALAVIAANIANLALNAVLIDGAGPVPALGAAGSVLGTALVRGGLMVVLTAGLLARLHEARPDASATDSSRQWRACLAATAIAATMHSFGLCLTSIAGWQGSDALALYATGWAINMPAMIVVSGLGDALALQATRQRDTPLALLLRGPVLLILVLGSAALLASPLVAAAYGLGEPLAGRLTALLPLTFMVLAVDAAALLIMSALRGRQHFVAPAAAQIISMGLAVPGAWWLAAGMAHPFGIRGMVLAILATSLLKLAALAVMVLVLPVRSATAHARILAA